MPNQPTAQAEQPPPDLPAMPENTMVNYLRSFTLWCRQGFGSKLDSHSASSAIMLQTYDTMPGTTPQIYRVAQFDPQPDTDADEAGRRSGGGAPLSPAPAPSCLWPAGR